MGKLFLIFFGAFFSCLLAGGKSLGYGSPLPQGCFPRHIGFWAFQNFALIFVIVYVVDFPQTPSLFYIFIAGVWGLYSLMRTYGSFDGRLVFEKNLTMLLRFGAFFAVGMTLFIGLYLFVKSASFFSMVGLTPLYTSAQWHPFTGMMDTVGDFGALSLFWGTCYIMLLSLVIGGPSALIIAIYLTFYVSQKRRKYLSAILEIAAGIPSIVYGFLALIFVSPTVQDIGYILGLAVSAENALGIALTISLMICPYIAAMITEVLMALPRTLKEGAVALGSTDYETIMKVILPAAFPGIFSALLLGISRAIGETMIVVMAAGMVANFTLNPLQSLTTVTVQIVNLLTGDQDFTKPATASAFALGFSLFCMTYFFNYMSLKVVNHYKNKFNLR